MTRGTHLQLRTFGSTCHRGLLFVVWFISSFCYADFRLAVINDPDGYTNVRQAPSPESPVVFKIEETELFLCEEGEGVWWKAKDFFGNQGFIHKSRVIYYDSLKDTEKEKLRAGWLNSVTDEVSYRTESIPFKTYPEFFYNSFDINRDLKHFSYHTGDCEGAHKMDLLFTAENTPVSLLKEVPAAPDRDIEKFRMALPILVSDSPPTKEDFKTKRGLAINSDTNDALKIFGQPHSQKREGDVKVFYWFWYFSPDLDKNIRLLEKKDSVWRFRGKPLERSGPFFSATLYFRESKLIGLIFLRDTGGCQ